MFLSDGDPNDGTMEIMQTLKSLLETVPDLITMVYGLEIDNEILRDIASHNFISYGISDPDPKPAPGEFENITPTNIRLVLGRFYANDKVNPNGLSENVQYSMPYVDSFGMGLMVTASKPVLDDSNKLQGVVGYDITLKYLLEPLEYLITETTYAWMFTRQRGYLIYHPKFVNPSASVSDINPVHFSILESDEGQVNAIKPLLKEKNFTLSYNLLKKYTIRFSSVYLSIIFNKICFIPANDTLKHPAKEALQAPQKQPPTKLKNSFSLIVKRSIQHKQNSIL